MNIYFKKYHPMNSYKHLSLFIALLTGILFSSCDKAVDELLDLAGANTFKENDVIFEKSSLRNVTSSTLSFPVGSKVQLYIGDVETQKTKSYEKAKWQSDDTDVATVAPATGNATIVTIKAVGTALITVSDNEGNLLTVTVMGDENLEDPETPEDPDDPEFPEDPEDPDFPEIPDDPEDPEEPEVQPTDIFDEDCEIINYTNGYYDVMPNVYHERPGNSIDVYVGDKNTMQPYGFTHLTWNSTNENVATVECADGNDCHIVMGEELGWTTITVSDDVGSTLGFNLECTTSPSGSRIVKIKRIK